MKVFNCKHYNFNGFVDEVYEEIVDAFRKGLKAYFCFKSLERYERKYSYF
jgi:hypothetical protein